MIVRIATSMFCLGAVLLGLAPADQYGATRKAEGTTASPVFATATAYSVGHQDAAVRPLSDVVDMTEWATAYCPVIAEETDGIECMAVTDSSCTQHGCTEDALCGVTQGNWFLCQGPTEVVGCTIHGSCTNHLLCTAYSDCTGTASCTLGDGCTAGQYCTGGYSSGFCTGGDACTQGTGCTSGLACTGGANCTGDEDYCTSGDYCTGGSGCTGSNFCTGQNNCTLSSGCTDASFNVNGCTAGPACTAGHFCTGGSQCTSLENYCTYGYCRAGLSAQEGSTAATAQFAQGGIARGALIPMSAPRVRLATIPSRIATARALSESHKAHPPAERVTPAGARVA